MFFRIRIRHSSGRPLVRGVRSGSKLPEEENSSDRSSVSSQDSSSTATPLNKKVGRRDLTKVIFILNWSHSNSLLIAIRNNSAYERATSG